MDQGEPSKFNPYSHIFLDSTKKTETFIFTFRNDDHKDNEVQRTFLRNILFTLGLYEGLPFFKQIKDQGCLVITKNLAKFQAFVQMEADGGQYVKPTYQDEYFNTINQLDALLQMALALKVFHDNFTSHNAFVKESIKQYDPQTLVLDNYLFMRNNKLEARKIAFPNFL